MDPKNLLTVHVCHERLPCNLLWRGQFAALNLAKEASSDPVLPARSWVDEVAYGVCDVWVELQPRWDGQFRCGYLTRFADPKVFLKRQAYPILVSVGFSREYHAGEPLMKLEGARTYPKLEALDDAALQKLAKQIGSPVLSSVAAEIGGEVRLLRYFRSGKLGLTHRLSHWAYFPQQDGKVLERFPYSSFDEYLLAQQKAESRLAIVKAQEELDGANAQWASLQMTA
jgi:hypothetical protein